MRNKKILITGHTGMIGGALTKKLQKENCILLLPRREELNLCDQKEVYAYFALHHPEYVFHLAAKVGGIYANQNYPAAFIFENTQMHCNVIQAAHLFGVKKLLFPGSACTYPKLASQPIKEEAFLNGQIEPTNIAYAAAKINGLIMCQSYAQQHGLKVVLPMPTNAYGIGDNFDAQASHVIPALMQRFHNAVLKKEKIIQLWGSGEVLREFIYVDDLADALIFLMENYFSHNIINVGTMQEISILNLAKEIARITGFQGQIDLDKTKPDGAPRKCLDSSQLFSMGWKPRVTLQDGLERMYKYFYLK